MLLNFRPSLIAILIILMVDVSIYGNTCNSNFENFCIKFPSTNNLIFNGMLVDYFAMFNVNILHVTS